jgi:hypothetical protein
MTQPALKQERQSAKTLTEFMGAHPRPRRYVPLEEQITNAKDEMPRMARAGDWGDATGMHMVALYSFMHLEVYGIEPLELDKKAWASGAKHALRCCEKFFGADYGALAEFMRWCWKREIERETWRKANHRDGGRLGWRYQFSASLVSDYRVHGVRTGQ